MQIVLCLILFQLGVHRHIYYGIFPLKTNLIEKHNCTDDVRLLCGMDLCLRFIDIPLSDFSCVSTIVYYYFSTPRLSATLAVN